MSIGWGLGFDAEVDYRLQRVRSDFGRINHRRRARAKKAAPSPRQPILTPRAAL